MNEAEIGVFRPRVSASGIGNPGRVEQSSLSAQTSWGVPTPRQLCGLRWLHLHGKRARLVPVSQPWPGTPIGTGLDRAEARFCLSCDPDSATYRTSQGPRAALRIRSVSGAVPWAWLRQNTVANGAESASARQAAAANLRPCPVGDSAAALDRQALPPTQRRDRVTLSARHHDWGQRRLAAAQHQPQGLLPAAVSQPVWQDA
jgi:hypothetical protein